MKHDRNNTLSIAKTSTLALLMSAGLTATAVAGDQMNEQGWDGEMKDAWVDGKLEASYALNEYLNPFAIDTDVKRGVVVLTGEVESEIDRDLAIEIARSIKGVTEVDDQLVIKTDAKRMERDDSAWSDFGNEIDAATTAARVKYALIENQNTDGLTINVDVAGTVVTLKGEVASEQTAELAERIARNAEGVEKVVNELTIAASS